MSAAIWSISSSKYLCILQESFSEWIWPSKHLFFYALKVYCSELVFICFTSFESLITYLILFPDFSLRSFTDGFQITDRTYDGQIDRNALDKNLFSIIKKSNYKFYKIMSLWPSNKRVSHEMVGLVGSNRYERWKITCFILFFLWGKNQLFVGQRHIFLGHPIWSTNLKLFPP